MKGTERCSDDNENIFAFFPANGIYLVFPCKIRPGKIPPCSFFVLEIPIAGITIADPKIASTFPKPRMPISSLAVLVPLV
jgi:hypothetical protein